MTGRSLCKRYNEVELQGLEKINRWKQVDRPPQHEMKSGERDQSGSGKDPYKIGSLEPLRLGLGVFSLVAGSSRIKQSCGDSLRSILVG